MARKPTTAGLKKRITELDRLQTAVKAADQALAESEQLRRATIENISDTVIITDDRGTFTYICPNTHLIFGLSAEQIKDLGNISLLLGSQLVEPGKFDARTEVCNIEKTITDAHGVDHHLLINVKKVAIQNGTLLYTCRDITDHKRTEQENQFLIELLNLINGHNDVRQLLQQIIERMQIWSGCEAAGIRLKDGEDYPFYETRGLPPDFVRAESRLCAYDRKGELFRDGAGNPVLECICGNIIAGKVKPDMPFYTPGGSFYANSTNDLLASAGDQDRRTRMRDRCQKEGYESLALFPLRTGRQTLGLIQFNDRERGRFTEAKIALFERLAGVLSMGLGQRLERDRLIASETKYLHLFKGSSDAIFLVDKSSGRYLDANAAALKLTGHSLSEIKGMTTSHTTPEGPARRIQLLPSCEETIELGEATFIRPDGTCRMAELSIVPLDNTRVFGIAHDITERKQAEAERQRLLSAIEQVAEAIVITDTQGDIQYVNPAFERISGYSRQEVLGKNPRVVKSGQQDQAFYQNLWNTITSGHTWAGHMVNKRKDGRLFAEECTISPVFDGAGAMVNFVAVKRDVTDESALQERLRQAQKMEAIGALAGGIAHDFNNILFPLTGFAEMLRDDLQPDSPLQDYVNEILQAALRSRDLVKQILAFSRQTDQQIKPIKLQSIIREALKLIRASVPSTIMMEQEIHPDCGVVLADPTQIHQIVMNLSTNAFHAMEENGGTLKVTLKQIRLEPDSPHLLDLAAGEYACLTVVDTGIGIESAIRDKIFDPYFTTKDKSKGTGLGLSVVQGIVKSCHGDIRISSQPGKGTNVMVLLPILVRKPEDIGPGESQTVPHGHGKILLVDDEEAIIRLQKKMLERLGYEVAERTSSTDALKAFRSNPDAYDLVITDMTMPDMTGDRLASEIMALKPSMPVIVCTGFSGKIDEEKALALGLKGLLMKPIIQSEMARMVRQVLDASRNQNEH